MRRSFIPEGGGGRKTKNMIQALIKSAPVSFAKNAPNPNINTANIFIFSLSLFV